jgi:hypothetical protein
LIFCLFLIFGCRQANIGRTLYSHGVVDTDEKFIGGVVDTGEEFFSGVIDTSDKF